MVLPLAIEQKQVKKCEKNERKIIKGDRKFLNLSFSLLKNVDLSESYKQSKIS